MFFLHDLREFPLLSFGSSHVPSSCSLGVSPLVSGFVLFTISSFTSLFPSVFILHALKVVSLILGSS